MKDLKPNYIISSGQRLTIPVSKKKLIRPLIAISLFVGLGFFYVLCPAKFKNPLFDAHIFFSIVGYVSIIFFGSMGIYLLKKIFENEPGLIIDNTGIINNISLISVIVSWAEISEISVMQILRNRMVVIKLKNPDVFISNQPNLFMRWIMRMNYKWFNAPVSISDVGLRISFEELLLILFDNLRAYRESHPNSATE